MGSLTRGGENPIPNQKTKGEKNIQKKTLQLARGAAKHTLFQNALESGEQCALAHVHT